MTIKKLTLALAALLLLVASGLSQTAKIPSGAKVYVAPISDGFDSYLLGAFSKKKVPLEIVKTKEEAQYIISGSSETQKASTAKKVIMWDWHSNEQASIQMSEVSSGQVVFAYSVNKQSSAHGKQSTAEACAKHLKEAMEKK